MIDRVTPVILTYNEAPNIGRCLSQLSWAQDIVVVDSFSDDGTLSQIPPQAPVRVFQRKFDTHRAQWEFALTQTRIKSEWVLALDADYILTDDFISELKMLNPDESVDGFEAAFQYAVFGKKLRTSLYPPVTVLYRRRKAFYCQDGHTQRIRVSGPVQPMRSYLIHDDRKSWKRWVLSQKRYATLEAVKLRESSGGPWSFPDRIRKARVVAPFAVLVVCLFRKGLILDGLPGIAYSFQRFFSESLLSFYMLKQDVMRIFKK